MLIMKKFEYKKKFIIRSVGNICVDISKSRMYKRSLISTINLLRCIRYCYYRATDRNVEFIEEKFVKWIG